MSILNVYHVRMKLCLISGDLFLNNSALVLLKKTGPLMEMTDSWQEVTINHEFDKKSTINQQTYGTDTSH